MSVSKFVIHLDRINQDTGKVAHLMDKFQFDMTSSGFWTPGFSFTVQANFLRAFPGVLSLLIEQRVLDEGKKDIFGNTYNGYSSYDYMEVALDYKYQNLTAIRLLGNTDKEPEKQTRFAIFGTVNTLFTPSIINTVADIRRLSDETTEFFGAPGPLDHINCGPQVGIGMNYATIMPTFGVHSRWTWTDYLNQYVVPRVRPSPVGTLQLDPPALKVLVGKFDQKSFKTNEEKLAEEREWSGVGFKSNIIMTRENAFDIVNTSAEILADPQATAMKIRTLADAYTHILDRVSLGCLIKSAMECIIPPLSCKEILRGSRIENIQEKMALAFPHLPRLQEQIAEAATAANEQEQAGADATDAFLDIIENFVDIEVICDIANFAAAGGFQIPSIELPEIDIIDLFGGVEIAIEDAILQALITAILELILGVLDDLQSCDNLDAFIAGAMNGSVPVGPDLGASVSKLFEESVGEVNSQIGSVASNLEERWSNFSNKMESFFESSIAVGIDGEVDYTDETVQLKAQLDAVGGLEGLRVAIEANIGVLATRAVLESFFQSQIDFTQLMMFQGSQNSSDLNKLVAEIGRFMISDDGSSFILRNISDDQTIIILNAIGSGTTSKDLPLSGKELSNSIGLLLDDVVALLSPADTLNLLAGTPSNKTVNLIGELIRGNHKHLSFMDKPEQIINIFDTMGRLTGTSNIKDGIILASNSRRTRNIPRKYCPEDDEALELQKDILTRNLPPEEVRDVIDEMIDKRKKRYNELGDILVRLNKDDFSPSEVLEPIICGLNPDGTRSPVVDDALNTTINTIFEPTKMAFDREVPRYPDAISSEEKIIRMVPRTIKRSGEQPVFGTGESLFGTFSDFLSSIGLDNPFSEGGEPEDIINPEWSRLIAQGLVPPESDGSARDDDKGPYTEGPPVPIQDVVKKVGANFKKSFRFKDAVSIKKTNSDAFEVQIKGSLPVQSPVQEFSPYPVSAPKWIMTYKEKGDNLSLSLSANGALFSQRFGRLPFSDNFYFGEKFTQNLDSDVETRIKQLSESGTLDSKPNIFRTLLMGKLTPAVKEDSYEELNASSEEYFDGIYKSFVSSFMSVAGTRVANNRLLKKLPNQSLNNLGPGTADFSKQEETETLVVNLINFSATPTDEQKKCGADPHLLDLEFIKSIVKAEYDKDCETESNNDGISRSRGPINSSGYVGVVLTIIRLYVIEYVLRGLFVFDEYGYKTDFAEDQLLIDYISFRIKMDLERQGNLEQDIRYYNRFETELKIAYKKLVENEQFDIPNEPLSPPDAAGVPSELKVLVREQLKAVLEKVREIVGVNTIVSGENPIKDLLSNIPVFDTYSNFSDGVVQTNLTSNDERFDNIFQPQPKNSIPFPPVAPEVSVKQKQDGKYIIEKYIRVPLSTNTNISNQQTSLGLVGVVNFRNWEEFLNGFPEITNKKIEEFFDQQWRYGYRVVFISPSSGESTITSGKNFQLLDGKKVKLNDSIIEHEKAFHVVEKSYKPVSKQDAPTFDSFLTAFGVGNNTDEQKEVMYDEYNTIPIAQSEFPINDFGKFSEVQGKLESTFGEKYEPVLLDSLVENVDIRTLFDYCFLSKRLVSFMLIHSSMVLNSEDMKFLFEGTKLELKKLFNILRNMGDYTSKSEGQSLDGVPGNAGAYKADFDQIGSPSGPKGPDAFYLASITPIMILRGLAELIDVNIGLTSKVVAAGNAGYLLPKFARTDSGDIKLSGTEESPGPPVIQFTPVGIINPNDGFECIVRGSDELPNFVKEMGGTIVEWKVPDTPVIPGLPPLTISTPGQPLTLPGFESPLVIPGIDTVLFIPFIENGVSNPTIFGLDRTSDSENPAAIVASVPEFPGESVNLPYGLVSMALLPLQMFFPILGPYSGPAYNTGIPLGIEFLRLEPLIYNLPNYKFAFENTDTAKEMLLSDGIDLGGNRKIKCADGEEPSEEPEVLPPNPNTPPKSDNC